MYVTFEIHLPAARGNEDLAFPAVISNALLRKLSVQWSYAERSPSQESRRQLQDRLVESRFSVNLSLPPSPLSIRELVELEPGRALGLPKGGPSAIKFNVVCK